MARRTGSAVALHALDLGSREPLPVEPAAAWLLEPDRPALVLGSAQPDADVAPDAAAAAGLEIGRRRSGGGAVLLWPGGQVWLDVLLARDHPRWDDRVDVATHWLGACWVEALAALGVTGAVHTGGHEPGVLGTAVCFAGVGAGEVIVGGRKVVGISQRRTRAWARFQTMAYVAGAPAASSPAADPPGPPRLADLARIMAPAAARIGRPAPELARALLPAPLPVAAGALVAALASVLDRA